MTRVPSRGGQRAPGAGPGKNPLFSRTAKAWFAALLVLYAALLAIGLAGHTARQDLVTIGPSVVVMIVVFIAGVLRLRRRRSRR